MYEYWQERLTHGVAPLMSSLAGMVPLRPEHTYQYVVVGHHQGIPYWTEQWFAHDTPEAMEAMVPLARNVACVMIERMIASSDARPMSIGWMPGAGKVEGVAWHSMAS